MSASLARSIRSAGYVGPEPPSDLSSSARAAKASARRAAIAASPVRMRTSGCPSAATVPSAATAAWRSARRRSAAMVPARKASSTSVSGASVNGAPPASGRQRDQRRLGAVDIAFALEESACCGHRTIARVRARSLFSAPGGMSDMRFQTRGVMKTIGTPSAPHTPSITPRARPKAKAATFASVGLAETNSQ